MPLTRNQRKRRSSGAPEDASPESKRSSTGFWKRKFEDLQISHSRVQKELSEMKAKVAVLEENLNGVVYRQEAGDKCRTEIEDILLKAMKMLEEKEEALKEKADDLETSHEVILKKIRKFIKAVKDLEK